MSRKHEAERLRIGVDGGWVPVSTVIEWADHAIEADAEPDPAIIDVALASNNSRSDVAALLALVKGEADSTVATRESLADLLLWVGSDIDRGASAARYLYNLACSGLLPETVFGPEPYGIDDHFRLALDGTYGTPIAALEQLRDYLERVSFREA